MLILKGKRNELYKLISNNPDETVALIKVKPSISLLAYLLSETKVKKIYFTPGIIKTINPKVLEAIKKVNVNFQIYTVKRGPPYRMSLTQIKKVMNLVRKGVPVKEACEKIGVPRRTFYYRIKKLKITIKDIKPKKHKNSKN